MSTQTALRYRMIHVDHYMSKPILPFDDLRSEIIPNRPVYKVPVLRIFGADSDGRKICLHVHGFYPYVAIQNIDPKKPVTEQLKREINYEIEKALNQVVEENKKKQQQDRNVNTSNQPPTNVESTNNVEHPVPGHSRATNRSNAEASSELDNVNEYDDPDLESRIINERRTVTHLSGDEKRPIHKIEHLKSFNYYGYHKNQEDFFKLYLYNPRMVKQLALICEDGKVFQKFIPIFWAHLPYILLFFIDNNLRGMGFIEVDQLYWRKDRAPQHTSSSSSNGSPNAFFNDEDIEPMSTCELEADIRYEWITNGKSSQNKGNHDGLKELWLEETFGLAPNNPSTQDMLQIEQPPVDTEPNLGVSGVRLIPDLNASSSTASIPVEDDEFSDEFSDDEQFFMEAIKKAESQLIELQSETTVKSEPSSSKVKVEPDNNIKREPGSAQVKQELAVVEAPLVSSVVSTETGPNQDKIKISDNSMIDGKSVVCSSNDPTQRSSSSSTRETVNHEFQYLCIMSMELHVTTRGKLRPDPVFDPIEALFYCIRNDTPETSPKPPQVVGLIITDPFLEEDTCSPQSGIKSPGARSNMSFTQKARSLLHKTGLSMKDIELKVVDTELELIVTLVEVVKTYDPEIMVGYEMEQLSWGYILERSSILNISISAPLSRIMDNNYGKNSKIVQTTFAQPIMFTGRMVFSVWRIITHDIHLNTSSFEKIHHHALNERVPCFEFQTLTKWFNENRNRWRVIDYYLVRVIGNMRIIDRFDLIAKVSELARVYGTQFIDVITRGSQIGIESMMLRLAKLQNLVPLSPTVMQRHRMKAPEALPLVMEPETNIYYDPVVVLDFQSLYPSIVIAYNYCYSTCLGRVSDLETNERHDFGCSQLYVEEDIVKKLFDDNDITVAPCGVAFVTKNIKHGVLPKMLNELIETRAMVKDQMKKNMKSARPNRRLQRILDHRQHGLKMMANTTYGYTGASYTGRMPCVEIADSIVSKGRETLENAIDIVESREEWGAKVIYGDTDSIFIEFKNCDRNTAFKRAYEMVDIITAANPDPIKMKFEKIYQPCVLQTKKRYCGFKYEHPDQKKPEFEAKGIETIRRDCCPAAAKMLEMALRIQFNTRDIRQVRKYVQHQFIKIMSGKLSGIQDYIFARQYKPRHEDKLQSVFVPAWQIAKRFLAVDPRSEPRLLERVPFVIIYGEPRTPLVNLAKTPLEVLENLSYRINADYYIQKIICPTLNRIFCTMNVDTLNWYKAMPRQNIIHRSHYLVAQKNCSALGGSTIGGGGGLFKQSTMSQFYSPAHCPVCAKSIQVSDDICEQCRNDMQSSVIRLSEEISRNQKKLYAYHQLCSACSSIDRNDFIDSNDEYYNPCVSYDCQNLFRYHQAKLDALNSNFLSQLLKELN